MNKEQFLSISLPFGLLNLFDNTIVNHEYDNIRGCVSNINNVKPILHPLSDLTKDEWIGKLNTFACELLDAAHVYDEKNIVGLNWMTQPFEIVMWLVKNHFNLMDESEPFIDVNTLEINPYK